MAEQIDPLIEEERIQKVIRKTYEWEHKYSGMTYAQGVREALEWILGEEEGEPFSELPAINPNFRG